MHRPTLSHSLPLSAKRERASLRPPSQRDPRRRIRRRLPRPHSPLSATDGHRLGPRPPMPNSKSSSIATGS